jgi:hypothetical protein
MPASGRALEHSCLRMSTASVSKAGCSRCVDKSDCSSATTTTIFLQVEGVYTFAMFRVGKSYLLQNPLGEGAEAKVVRVRGIPRKAQSHLATDRFTQDPAINFGAVRTTAMRPTGAGLQMVMTRESKSLSNSINAYRCMTVRFDNPRTHVYTPNNFSFFRTGSRTFDGAQRSRHRRCRRRRRRSRQSHGNWHSRRQC